MLMKAKDPDKCCDICKCDERIHMLRDRETGEELRLCSVCFKALEILSRELKDKIAQQLTIDFTYPPVEEPVEEIYAAVS